MACMALGKSRRNIDHCNIGYQGDKDLRIFLHTLANRHGINVQITGLELTMVPTRDEDSEQQQLHS